jgi:hypothetical protein
MPLYPGSPRAAINSTATLYMMKAPSTRGICLKALHPAKLHSSNKHQLQKPVEGNNQIPETTITAAFRRLTSLVYAIISNGEPKV